MMCSSDAWPQEHLPMEANVLVFEIVLAILLPIEENDGIRHL